MILPGPVIGYATMDEDKTVHLYLLATDGDGTRGQGKLTYTPRDPIYRQLLVHLGNIRPGTQVPYREWPEPKLFV